MGLISIVFFFKAHIFNGTFYSRMVTNGMKMTVLLELVFPESMQDIHVIKRDKCKSVRVRELLSPAASPPPPQVIHGRPLGVYFTISTRLHRVTL